MLWRGVLWRVVLHCVVLSCIVLPCLALPSLVLSRVASPCGLFFAECLICLSLFTLRSAECLATGAGQDPFAPCLLCVCLVYMPCCSCVFCPATRTFASQQREQAPSALRSKRMALRHVFLGRVPFLASVLWRFRYRIDEACGALGSQLPGLQAYIAAGS